jgi:NADH-quinone oxidoreductase subunit D
VEELIQLKVQKRVQFFRMILSELYRISNHLYFISKMNKVLGHNSAYNIALIERERVLRLLEVITGARIIPNFIRIGGMKSDLDGKVILDISENLKSMMIRINSLETIMMDNSIITSRLKDLGISDSETATTCGATGPNLRASGIRYDLRKNRNLFLYKDISFLIPVGKYGDCLDRVHMRFREIYQSILIIGQIIKLLPDEHIKKIINLDDLDLPFSEMISSIECPHGIFKIFLEAEGNKILNLIIMGPSGNNLYLARKVLLNTRLKDLEIILTSFDISCGEMLNS